MTDPSLDVAERPLFTLSVSSIGLEWSPRTIDEVREWLEAEAKEWEWLRTIRRPDASINGLTSIQFYGEQDLNSLVAALAKDPERRAELAPQLHARLDHRFNQEKALYSKSPAAKFVQSIKEKSTKVAAHTAYILIGRDPEPSRHGYIASALVADYMFGPQSVPQSAATAWADIVSSLNAGHEKLRAEAGVAADEWRARRDDITNLHTHQRGSFDTDQGTRASAFNTQQSEHEKRMAQIEETFKTGQSLKAAVTYFTKKAKRHAEKAKTFAWCSGVTGAVVTALVCLSLLVVTADPKPFQMGVALALAFLALWLLRVFVRLFFSNTHLATEMETRATLVETYLALIQDGAGLQEKDRARIVELVFRPASDGLVKEDGAPPTLFSLFQRGATGG